MSGTGKRAMELDEVPITIIGHPWAPIGMGEQMRSHVQACGAVHLHHRVFDIFRYAQHNDPAHTRMLGELEIEMRLQKPSTVDRTNISRAEMTVPLLPH